MVGTGPDAVSAANAFSMIWVMKDIYIHLTYPTAYTAGGAFGGVDMQPGKGKFVEQSIQCAQRAQPFAKRTIKEDG